LETIKKGGYDTKVALYDNFNLPDLAKFCKEKGIKSSGKKNDLIKRILHYLATGEVAAPKKEKPSKGKRSREDNANNEASPSKKQKNN